MGVRVRRSDALHLREGVHPEPRSHGLAPLPLTHAVHHHRVLRTGIVGGVGGRWGKAREGGARGGAGAVEEKRVFFCFRFI